MLAKTTRSNPNTGKGRERLCLGVEERSVEIFPTTLQRNAGDSTDGLEMRCRPRALGVILGGGSVQNGRGHVATADHPIMQACSVRTEDVDARTGMRGM